SNVLVTGGAKGLGLSFAKALARRYGCALTLTGRTPVADVSAVPSARYLAMDVPSPRGPRRLHLVGHAAGVLDGDLETIVETKVPRKLLALTQPKLFIGIGSWAGRFGNAGQTDYSAANAMLAALDVPNARTLVIDFPPFEESTMVRRI